MSSSAPAPRNSGDGAGPCRYLGRMSGILSRWLVLHEHQVAPADLDAQGALLDAAVEAWIAGALDSYLARCVLIQEIIATTGVEIARLFRAVPAGSVFGAPTRVVVSATATEVHPEAFTIAVRIRPLDGDRDSPTDMSAVIRLQHATTGEVHAIVDDIRDELIALEHSAQHFN